MTIFPFNLAAEHPDLTFYIVVYVLTLILHAVFMTYVLAGSAYLAWATLFPGDNAAPESNSNTEQGNAGSEVPPRAQQPVAKLLRKWMPFVLSAAITAGVAPLLFVQIIYREEFYTANLLLGWRWMVVIPVLIVAFYLLYVLKSRVIADWSFVSRAAIGCTIAVCFLFVAFCWSTNHLLQLDREAWPEIYESSVVLTSAGPLSLRLLTWFCGAFPVMAAFVGWQLHSQQQRPKLPETSGENSSDAESLYPVESRRLSIVALGGLILSLISGVLYLGTTSADFRDRLFAEGLVWLVIALAGIALQGFGWLTQLKARCLCRLRMAVVTMGSLLMLVGIGFTRELLRVSRLNLNTITDDAQIAAEVGGFGLFIGFTVLNIALIGYCIRLVSGRSSSPIAND